ncbi:hypothetical protein AURDEDRAFT_160289 [Auricularia subglabra TFB-10046 SS5]|nr:hypothetical protein AURDEDRAFT_160289 [Auricularia subglabra TFB-10046 SS5]
MDSPDSHCWMTVTVTNLALNRNSSSLPPDEFWEIGPVSPISLYYLSTGVIAHLAAACWLICDHIDTFHDEVIYIWHVYFEYYCDDTAYSRIQGYDLKMDVQGWAYRFYPALHYLIFWIVAVIMQMRIFALYKSRALALINGALFFAGVLAMSLIWSFNTLPPVCFEDDASQSFGTSEATWGLLSAVQALIYWAPGVAFELWLAALAAVKMRRRVLKTDLLGVLLNDSLIYFLMVSALMVMHLVLSMHRAGSHAAPFVIAGETIAGSRLVIHLRKAYYAKRDGASAGASQPDISFAMPTQNVAASSRRVVDESFYDYE